MGKDTYGLRVSDTAWEGITSRARDAQFVRQTTGKGAGIYMCRVLEFNPNPSNWTDTRPESIKAYDLQALEAGHFRVWDLDENRRLRSVKLGAWELETTSKLARALGVVRDNQGLRALTITSLISEFWEAFGLNWLGYEYQPPPTWANPSRHAKPMSELDW